jgi:hypothetical protein
MDWCSSNEGSSAGSGSVAAGESVFVGEPGDASSELAVGFCVQPTQHRSMKKASNSAIKQLNFFILLPRSFLVRMIIFHC